MSLSGWGHHPVHRCLTYRPESWRDAREIVLSTDPGSIIVRGAGRSYGDASLNSREGVLLSTRFRRLLDFDDATGVVECEAGVTFDDLLRTFVPKGYFPPVTPGTKFVTIGGAVAADVHGKNHHRDGSFGSHVLALTLLISDGTILDCSRESHPDAFFATLGGMGLTGVILTVRLRMRRIESSYLVVDYKRAANLDDVLSCFEEDDSRYEYSVAWMDCLARGAKFGRSILMNANTAETERLPEKMRRRRLEVHKSSKLFVPPIVPSAFWSNGLARQFNRVFYNRHRNKTGMLQHYDPFFYPLDGIDNWNRLYGPRGFWQFQMVLDRAAGKPGMMALLESVRSSRYPCPLAVIKAFGDGSGGILSFPARGYTLSLDIPNRKGSQEFLMELDGIVREYGGRTYLAKDAFMSSGGFREMYPSAGEFERIKAQLDPGARFSSSLSRRIGLS
jgi:decaprenylphospho-beta-D-ribofuranose 2-oxidase